MGVYNIVDGSAELRWVFNSCGPYNGMALSER